MQRKALALTLFLLGPIACENATGDDSPKPIKCFSYHSDEAGCRANAATELTLPIDGEGQQWVIVAPARVVSTGRHQTYAELAEAPLDIEVAKPLELAMQNKMARKHSAAKDADRPSKITRIKIVSVSHGVSGLGMGKAQAHIRLDFYICINGDVPESNVVKTVARNGPNMSTLWHQPRGEELRHGFQQAADQAISAIADFALRSVD
jgi:hypothetical protein